MSTNSFIQKEISFLFLGYPAQEFVLVTLSTLTQLAAATLVDIPSQVNLLLEYMKNDTRRQVKLESLKHLYHLAKPGAHLWPPKALEEFIDYVLNMNDKRLLYSGLREYLNINAQFVLMVI